MSHQIFSVDYRDVNDNPIIFSDNVRFSKYYNTSGESWDKTGGTTASWYTENQYPNDSFISGIDSEKWLDLSTASSYSISVANKASFSLNDTSGNLYLSSKGLWQISGDFSIRLGLNLDDYYDEYRSSSSFGLNVSIGDLYNIRIAVIRNYGSTSYKFQALYTELADPLFFGWSSLGDEYSFSDVRFFVIERSGTTISCYVNGSTKIGEIQGASWSGAVDVSIGSECPEVNKFIMSSSYFFISEGTITPETTFSSSIRGPDKDFPDEVLIVVDDTGMSIIDISNYSLWMRFVYGVNKMFNNIDCKISALEGKISLATSGGLFVVDFISDEVIQYSGSYIKYPDVGIALRNAEVTFDNLRSSRSLTSDVVNNVVSKKILGEEVSAVTTVSGLDLLFHGYPMVYNVQGISPSDALAISNENSLYWAGYNDNNEGELSYYSNIENLLTLSGVSFNRTAYYSKDTTPYTLTSENILSISPNDLQVAIGTADGINVLFFPAYQAKHVKSFGNEVVDNPISDSSFETPLLTSAWSLYDSAAFPAALIQLSTSWVTSSTGNSLNIKPGNGESENIILGESSGVSQSIDLTGVERIYFDIKRVGPTSDGGAIDRIFYYEILIDSTIIKYYEEGPTNGEVVLVNEYIDVDSFSGSHTIYIRARRALYSSISGFRDLGSECFFSYFRTLGSTAEYDSMGGNDPGVKDIFIVFEENDKKVSYVTSEGYGSIDLFDNTEDFFYRAEDIPPGTTFNQADLIYYESS
jgi:hypothetical protein